MHNYDPLDDIADNHEEQVAKKRQQALLAAQKVGQEFDAFINSSCYKLVKDHINQTYLINPPHYPVDTDAPTKYFAEMKWREGLSYFFKYAEEVASRKAIADQQAQSAADSE